MPGVNVRIEGLPELLSRLNPNLYRDPLRKFFKRSVLAVEAEAKQRAPVDTGRLRSSITSEVDAAPIPGWGRVGTNVDYGLFVEEGTSPHFPPPSALQPWAQRHGFGPKGGFLVARAISRRGTRPKPFLRPALQASVGKIRGYLSDMGRDIEQRWGR